MNIKSSFNRHCCSWCLTCFLQLGQRASACTFDHLFVWLPSLCLGVCLSFVFCLNISLPLIQLLLRSFKALPNGPIVADTLLPSQRFPRLPTRATFVADTNFVQPEENISRVRTQLLPKFFYYSSLMVKRYFAM